MSEAENAANAAFGAGGLNRVVVVGTTGSGKSTIAQQLARSLGHPYVELDELYWGPNWQPKPLQEFQSLVRDVAASDRWVADGNYERAREALWPQAEAVIWLDFRLGVVLRRVLLRTARRFIRREVLWHGNREPLLVNLFTRESVIWWTLTTHRRRKREFSALRKSGLHPDLHWIVFTEPRQVDCFLAALPSSPG